MTQALEGITVVELVQKGPGAFVTMMLADMGANVIKVEPPGKISESGSGGSPAIPDDRGQTANVVNRGKRSIVLNLKAPEAHAILHSLVRGADVLVEGFRPGVTAKLSADFATLTKINPALVYCSLSGYGQDGRYRDLPGHDVNFLGMAGILDLIGEPDRPPVVPPNLIADYGGAALHAVCGIMFALFARNRTGRGQMVDISYLDSALALMSATRATSKYLLDGTPPKRGKGALAGHFAYYGIYETRDGKYVSIGCVEPWLWKNLCNALERPDLIPAGPKPEDFDGIPSAQQERCKAELGEIFKTRKRDEWFQFLQGANVCIGKVHEFPEIFDDPHLIDREMVVRVSHPALGEVLQIGAAIKLSDTPAKAGPFAPWKGQHTAEILGELGFNDDALPGLRARGVI